MAFQIAVCKQSPKRLRAGSKHTAIWPSVRAKPYDLTAINYTRSPDEEGTRNSGGGRSWRRSRTILEDIDECEERLSMRGLWATDVTILMTAIFGLFGVCRRFEGDEGLSYLSVTSDTENVLSIAS